MNRDQAAARFMSALIRVYPHWEAREMARRAYELADAYITEQRERASQPVVTVKASTALRTGEALHNGWPKDTGA